MVKITLQQKSERRVLGGHPWVFSNEIAALEGLCEPGCSCQIYSAAGKFLGVGYYNPHTLIAARILSREPADIDSTTFYHERIAAALAYRGRLYPELDAYRIVYGESDRLPGLVIDRYADVISLQLLSQGMDRRRELIVSTLQQLLEPVAIVARNDAGVRELEGLPRQVELLAGQLPEQLIIGENGFKFKVDIMGGQKTGAFLDQKENHRALQGRVAGRRVLDLFCYSGSWSIHAAGYGAATVTGCDISPAAITLAKENAHLNQVESICNFQSADAFELLKQFQRERQRFDAIILDPPAFVKSKKKLAEAVRGYLTINRRALELLEPGGYIFTCSCSYHLGRELFLDTLRKAAEQAGRQLRLVEVRGQAYDHPVLLACPETDYLKCIVLQAV